MDGLRDYYGTAEGRQVDGSFESLVTESFYKSFVHAILSVFVFHQI